MISLLTIIFVALAGGAVVKSQVVPDCDLDFASLATGLLQAHMDDPLKLSHIEAILSSCNKSRMQKLTEISVYLLHKGTFQTKTMEDIRRLAETLRNERKKRLDQMRRKLPAVLARTMDEASRILMNNTLSGNEKVMSLSNALGSLPREHRQTLEQFFNREATPSQMDPEAFDINKAKEAHQLHGVPIGVDPHGRTEHRKDMTRSFPIEQDSRPFKSTEDSMLQFERLPASSAIRKSDTPPLYDTQDQSMPLKNPDGPVRLGIPPAIYDYNGGGGRLIDVMTKNKRQQSDSTSYMGSFNSPIRPFVSTNGRPHSVGTTRPDLSQMDDADLLNPRTSLLSDAVHLLERTIPMVRPSPQRNRPPNIYAPAYTFPIPETDYQPPQNEYGNPRQVTEERSLLPSRDDVIPPSTHPINPINSAKTGMELSTYDTNLGRFAGGVPNSVVLPSAAALPAKGMESISPPNRNYLVAKPEAQRPSYNIYPDHRAGLFPEAVNQAQFERQAERPLKYGGQSPDRWATQDNREGALSVKTVIAPAAGRGTVMIENFPPAPYEIAPVPKQTIGDDLLETDRLGSWSMGRFDKEEPRYPTPEPKRDTTTIISVPVESASRSTMYPPATLLEETTTPMPAFRPYVGPEQITGSHLTRQLYNIRHHGRPRFVKIDLLNE